MTPRKLLAALRVTIPRVAAVDCAARVRAGSAVLVDVRERREWEGGFAESAELLPLSQLSRSQVDFAALGRKFGERELFLYCGAGVRSHLAARILRAEGFRASNAGSLSEWAASGWPIVKPDSK